MMRYNTKYRLFSIVFICFLIGLVPNIAMAQSGSFELYKGVVVDKDNSTIYLINPNGGLDGVTIQSGAQKWHSESGDLPILVQGSLLLTQKQTANPGELMLTMLDTVTGNLKQEKLFILTNGVRTNISQSLDNEFKISASSSNAQNTISWSYQHKVAQGMLSEKHPVLTKKYGEILLDNNNSLNAASFVTLSQKPPSSFVNLEGSFIPNINGRQFKSITRAHILVSNINKNSQLLEKYNWDIYNLNGNLIGSMKHASSFRPFVVQGDLILFVNMPYLKANKTSMDSFPLNLKAYSLSTGKTIWAKEIRDLSFKGQYPQ